MFFWGSDLGAWWLWVVFYIFFLAGIVILIVFLVKVITGSGKKILPPSKEDPLDILKKRYAKGEINKEQFDQMKEDIKS